MMSGAPWPDLTRRKQQREDAERSALARQGQPPAKPDAAAA
jgi:hypothetical protein